MEKEALHTCKNCFWFEGEDQDGWGFCDEKEAYTREDCQCQAWESLGKYNDPRD